MDEGVVRRTVHNNFVAEFHLKSTNKHFCPIPKLNRIVKLDFYGGYLSIYHFPIVLKFWSSFSSPCRLRCARELIITFLPILTMMENSMVKAEINQYLDIAKHLTVAILRDAS